MVVYRCYSCGKLITDIQISKYGCCPSCSGKRVRGASPTLMEVTWLKLKYLFQQLFMGV